jgi:hypothetical protein
MRMGKFLQISTAVGDRWATYFSHYRILIQLVNLEPKICITKLVGPEFRFNEDKTTINLSEIQMPYIVNKLSYRTITNVF